MSSEDVYLVTGSLGCLGAWTLRHLVEDGRRCVSFDISESRHRLDLLMDAAQQKPITFVRGDLTDQEQVAAAVEDHGVTRIIHLAALQIPFCRADPSGGAAVNVVGTANVFEAARRAGLAHLTYASSVAVYGPGAGHEAGAGAEPSASERPLPHGTVREPETLYGVYKVANEDMARVYRADHGIGSIGLRPYTVYGPGRDQGLTSDPTKAMLAAVDGEPFEIGFSGPMQFHYAPDTARQFIAAADQVDFGRADCFDLGGQAAEVDEVIDLIRANRPDASITRTDQHLPFPPAFSNEALTAAVPEVHATSLTDGVAETMDLFAELRSAR